MIKILHAADFHLGARFRSLPPEQAARRRQQLRSVLTDLCRLRQDLDCRLVLLAGDLLDRPQGCREEARALAEILEAMEAPVFVAPGNHDYLTADSPYLQIAWPKNVHIFTQPELTSVCLPELDCRVWGAGFSSMDCPGLLEGFRAPGEEPLQLMVLHADPVNPASPCCPVTRAQVEASGLAYLALGHIHTKGTLRAGHTLCAWPGCPMGRGFDETGVKGVYLAEVSPGHAEATFVPSAAGRYMDLSVPAGPDPLRAVSARLPAGTEQDVYRITLTGEAPPVNCEALRRALEGRFFSLQLQDRTMPPRNLWEQAGEDSLEGRYFQLLQEAAERAEGAEQEALCLAARISRQILDGQEVTLP